MEKQAKLGAYIRLNPAGNKTVDFHSPEAVKYLNQALLLHDYGLTYWDFPAGHLCPPVPGRADYIHYIADVLAEDHGGEIPRGEATRLLDVGCGASLIYPIVGSVEYGWRWIATDIEASSLDSAREIVARNEGLKGKVQCRLQKQARHFFRGVINKKERIAASVCNPPFYANMAFAQKAHERKLRQLGKGKLGGERNFSGQLKELVYPGGEYAFIMGMIAESKHFAEQIRWFSCLVSRKENCQKLERYMKKQRLREIRVIPMGTGNKQTRVLLWRP